LLETQEPYPAKINVIKTSTLLLIALDRLFVCSGKSSYIFLVFTPVLSVHITLVQPVKPPSKLSMEPVRYKEPTSRKVNVNHLNYG
jgi:hypothetical protein